MNEQFSILKSDAEVRTRLKELAADISKDFQHIQPDNPLLVLCTLRGAVFFAADLVRALTIPCEINFIKVKSYQGTRPVGSPIFELGEQIDVKGREVLIIEDIVDTGYPMQSMLEPLGTREPASLEIASLFVKPARLKVPVDVKYSVFTIPDRFIVGFGLDYDELGRNFKDIYMLDE